MNTLTRFAEGVWVDTAPQTILGMPLTATMTVVRLAGGTLLLYSPLAMTPERRAAVEALGAVSDLYAPNTFHHLSIGDWASAFPSARVHAPAGLSKKRPDLKVDRVHVSGPEPRFDGTIEEISVGGFRLEETVLYHLPSKTLFVADLVQNVGRPDHGWARFYTKTMGFYDRVALSRVIRWTGFSDRSAARRSLDTILSRPFESLVVGHGVPVTSGARDAVTAAYDWLK